ncbi:phage integrase family protein (plasmid) [Sinorhizobium fredii NGR234]|uniref:Phage integrase family protein n=1 Tax=Sinorhizobium fredii (strain NBRC 101917 / NGR234) TaxID=394 RepID=C3KPG2_SINFN|nr:phage integrase family protein [Sinorhizobium fredii NGR234]
MLGHKKLESNVQYLGIEVDDALAISEQVELYYRIAVLLIEAPLAAPPRARVDPKPPLACSAGHVRDRTISSHREREDLWRQPQRVG